jgi:hypothetical protein
VKCGRVTGMTDEDIQKLVAVRNEARDFCLVFAKYRDSALNADVWEEADEVVYKGTELLRDAIEATKDIL